MNSPDTLLNQLPPGSDPLATIHHLHVNFLTTTGVEPTHLVVGESRYQSIERSLHLAAFKPAFDNIRRLTHVFNMQIVQATEPHALWVGVLTK